MRCLLRPDAFNVSRFCAVHSLNTSDTLLVLKAGMCCPAYICVQVDVRVTTLMYIFLVRPCMRMRVRLSLHNKLLYMLVQPCIPLPHQPPRVAQSSHHIHVQAPSSTPNSMHVLPSSVFQGML